MPFDLLSTPFGTDADITDRMADVGLSSASQDATVNGALVARKGAQAREQLISDLLGKIAVAMQPLGMYPGGVLSSSLNAPEDILATLTNPEVLKETWVIYSCYAILEEGETRMRFKYEDAGKAISDTLKSWERKKVESLEGTATKKGAWARCAFDLNGDNQLTYIERGFTNRLSSVRTTF